MDALVCFPSSPTGTPAIVGALATVTRLSAACIWTLAPAIRLLAVSIRTRTSAIHLIHITVGTLTPAIPPFTTDRRRMAATIYITTVCM